MSRVVVGAVAPPAHPVEFVGEVSVAMGAKLFENSLVIAKLAEERDAAGCEVGPGVIEGRVVGAANGATKSGLGIQVAVVGEIARNVEEVRPIERHAVYDGKAKSDVIRNRGSGGVIVLRAMSVRSRRKSGIHSGYCVCRTTRRRYSAPDPAD